MRATLRMEYRANVLTRLPVPIGAGTALAHSSGDDILHKVWKIFARL